MSWRWPSGCSRHDLVWPRRVGQVMGRRAYHRGSIRSRPSPNSLSCFWAKRRRQPGERTVGSWFRGRSRHAPSGTGRTKRQDNDYGLCVAHNLPPTICCRVIGLYGYTLGRHWPLGVKNGQLGTSPVVVVSKKRSRYGSARRGDDLRPPNLVDVQLESPGKLAAAIVHVEGTAYQGCAVGPPEPANCPTVICRALEVHEHPGRLPAVESYFPYAKAVGT